MQMPELGHSGLSNKEFDAKDLEEEIGSSAQSSTDMILPISAIVYHNDFHLLPGARLISLGTKEVGQRQEYHKGNT